jgi:hypothetical protein
MKRGIEEVIVILALYTMYFAFLLFVIYVMPWGLGQ